MVDFERIDYDTLKRFVGKAPDYQETERLKEELNRLKGQRDPFYLTLDEVDKVVRWKLDQQYHRGKERRNKTLTDKVARLITKSAFLLTHPDKDEQAKLRINMLRVPDGIGIAIASAILGLCFPEEYPVIDRLNWKLLYGEEHLETFGANHYIFYMKDVKKIAKKLGVIVQEADLTLWTYVKGLDRQKLPIKLPYR